MDYYLSPNAIDEGLDGIRKEYQRVVQEANSLKQKCQSYEAQIRDLTEKYDKSTNDNRKLSSENERLRKALSALDNIRSSLIVSDTQSSSHPVLSPSTNYSSFSTVPSFGPSGQNQHSFSSPKPYFGSSSSINNNLNSNNNNNGYSSSSYSMNNDNPDNILNAIDEKLKGPKISSPGRSYAYMPTDNSSTTNTSRLSPPTITSTTSTTNSNSINNNKQKSDLLYDSSSLYRNPTHNTYVPMSSQLGQPSMESFMEQIRPKLAPIQFQKILSIIQSYHKQTITRRSAQNQAQDILGKFEPRYMSDFMSLL